MRERGCLTQNLQYGILIYFTKLLFYLTISTRRYSKKRCYVLCCVSSPFFFYRDSHLKFTICKHYSRYIAFSRVLVYDLLDSAEWLHELNFLHSSIFLWTSKMLDDMLPHQPGSLCASLQQHYWLWAIPCLFGKAQVIKKEKKITIRLTLLTFETFDTTVFSNCNYNGL